MTDKAQGTAAGYRPAVSVVLPAYNEEQAIGEEIRSLREMLSRVAGAHEIIVVDDGSTDATFERGLAAGARGIKHINNRGYGASLKTGILAAKYETILITDADGTYPVEHIPTLLAELERADMVVGARVGANVNIPLIRRPAKWMLGMLANHIAGQRIPDLNSGLRAFRRETVLPYFSLLSNRFSFTTTITLALLGDDYRVVYVPINYLKRTGRSKITPWHFMEFMILVLRMAMLFQPLRVFLPASLAFLALGITKAVIDVATFLTQHDHPSVFGYPVLSTSSLLLLSVALQLGVLGLVADGVIRRIIQQHGPMPPSHGVHAVEPAAQADGGR
ncbi:MAG TPA: glycosyltransferase family 2 protein [Gemmatimonadaceae bacterium]|nr:glycosyltransferase family 2 protein [Gemmatimonadaceae bacterium]